MKTLVLFTSLTVLVLITLIVCIAFANGITYMRDRHPDYKGEDMFDDTPSK